MSCTGVFFSKIIHNAQKKLIHAVPLFAEKTTALSSTNCYTEKFWFCWKTVHVWPRWQCKPFLHNAGGMTAHQSSQAEPLLSLISAPHRAAWWAKPMGLQMHERANEPELCWQSCTLLQRSGNSPFRSSVRTHTHTHHTPQTSGEEEKIYQLQKTYLNIWSPQTHGNLCNSTE